MLREFLDNRVFTRRRQPQARETNPYRHGPDYTIDPAKYGFKLVLGEPHETPNSNASREFVWIRE